jgi:nucleoside 2-deoxyribosyltransferase
MPGYAAIAGYLRARKIPVFSYIKTQAWSNARHEIRTCHILKCFSIKKNADLL